MTEERERDAPALPRKHKVDCKVLPRTGSTLEPTLNERQKRRRASSLLLQSLLYKVFNIVCDRAILGFGCGLKLLFELGSEPNFEAFCFSHHLTSYPTISN